jgi:uncharacterized protein YkwD
LRVLARACLAALAIGCIAVTALWLAGAAQGAGHPPGGCPGARTSAANGEQFLRAVLCLHNAERRRRGLGPLRRRGTLRRAARRHARDMVRRRYFGHVSPNGADPVHRALGSGYRKARRISVGENILTWAGTLSAATVMQKWMESASHRRDILRRRWRDVGIAVLRSCTSGARGLTLVVEFGRKYR